MQQIVVVPGLMVSDEMFECAQLAVATCAPDLPELTWEQFTSDENWFLVPGPDGFGYKGEYVVTMTQERTIKLNRWMAPDLRKGQTPQPHNHPWQQFDGHILLGGYTEDRYERADDGVHKTTVTHRQGSINTLLQPTFHEVTEIESGTLTMMLCAEGVRGAWGYIDPNTGEFRHNKHPRVIDPTFKDHAKALNPRLR
jgi:hypothetical protein